MSEKTVLKENQLLVKGNLVTITSYSSKNNDPEFDYKLPSGIVTSSSVKALQPETYTQIIAAIKNFEANMEQIRKEREELAEKERMAKTLKDLEDFKTWFQQNLPTSLKNRPAHFKDPSKLRSWDEVKEIYFYTSDNKSHVSLEPAPQTFDEWHYRPRHDGKNWSVKDIDYHGSTYKTLEKAAAKINELLTEYETVENAATVRTNAYNTFATECNLVISKGWHRNEYDRQRRGFETYHMQPKIEKEFDTPPYKFNLSISFDNKVNVTAVTISKPINLNLGKFVKNAEITFTNPLTSPNEVKALITSIHRAMKEAEEPGAKTQ